MLKRLPSLAIAKPMTMSKAISARFSPMRLGKKYDTGRGTAFLAAMRHQQMPYSATLALLNLRDHEQTVE
jgi:hypothetical protein